MTKTNVFICFDLECSVEELLTEVWTTKIRERIKKVDLVIFLCGEYTNSAKGVGVEFGITKEQAKPYIFLQGRMNKAVRKLRRAADTDKVYAWTLDNLKVLVGGAR